MSRVRVEVTQDDIDRGLVLEPLDDGTNGRAYTCPLARALRRAGYEYPRVYTSGWYPDESVAVSFPLTKKARRFIDRVDTLPVPKPVRPTSFYLEGPDR